MEEPVFKRPRIIPHASVSICDPRDSCNSLPDEIWQIIFTRFSLMERVRLELVCRQFRRIMPYGDIRTVDFGKLFLRIGTQTNQVRLEQFFWSFWKKAHKQLKSVGIKDIVFVSGDLSADCLLAMSTTLSESLEVFIGRYNAHILQHICLGSFPNLHTLKLTGSFDFPIHYEVHMKTFAKSLPKLRRLHCRTWLPYSFPARLQKLKCESSYAPLVLRGVPMTGGAPTLDCLEKLVINHCKIDCTALNVETLPGLKTLVLIGGSLKTVFSLSARTTSLTKLHLIGVHGHDITHICSLMHLEELKCSACNDIFQALQMLRAPKLRRLEWCDYDAPVDAILNIIATQFRLLEYLQVDHSEVEDALDEIVGLTALSSLLNRCKLLQNLCIPLGGTAALADASSALVRVDYRNATCFMYDDFDEVEDSIANSNLQALLTRLQQAEIIREKRLEIFFSSDKDISARVALGLAERGFLLRFNDD